MKNQKKNSFNTIKLLRALSVKKQNDICTFHLLKTNCEKLIYLIFFALFALLPTQASAVINCTANATGRTTYVDYNVPILPGAGIQVSALRNTTNGTVLWSQKITNPDKGFLGNKGCTITTGENKTLTYYYNMEGNLPAVVGQWLNRNMYDTGVPGIGLVVMGDTGTTSFPYTLSYTQNGAGWSNMLFNNRLSLWIYLVKYGDVPAGTWTVPISVPAVTLHSDVNNNESGPESGRDYSARLIFESGSINVVSGTCQTPDVNVPMGTHTVSDDLENTPWVEFSVELNNCPPMFGFYGGKNTTAANFKWAGEDSSDNIITAAMNPNTLSLSFQSVHGVVQGANGWCAKIASTSDSARGVCLEILDKFNVNVIEKSISNQKVDSGLNLLNSVSNYSVPLKARYTRIAENTPMTPGNADSAVEFTIYYY